MILLNKLFKTEHKVIAMQVRKFGGSHNNHDDHHDDHHDDGHHDDHHGDAHHDDHHHHEIVKADPNHQFIAPCNKKTLVLDGLKGTGNVVIEVTNPYAHQNNLPLYQ